MTAGQRAAWDTYLALTTGVLRELDNHAYSGEQFNPRLGHLVIRIRRYAPLWGTDGRMLLTAAHCAVHLYMAGDWPSLTGLLHAIAHRLFRLSGRTLPRHPGRNPYDMA